MAVEQAIVWVYPWDLIDEGIENVLNRLKENEVEGISVAVYYHSGRFLLPHNPNRKVHFPEPGSLYIQPDVQKYKKTSIKPPVSKFADDEFWHQLREETKKREMTLTAWVLGCHNSHLATERPELSTVNPFGDTSRVAVDPAHPEVKVFFEALMEDLSTNYQFDRILIESLEYMPFRHDFHHEVIGIPTTPVIEFFMGLTFSEAMKNAAKQENININEVQNYVQEKCQSHFDNPFEGGVELSWDEVYAACNGEMKKYLNLRKKILTDLIASISQKIRENNSNIKIAALDFGPLFGMGHYQTEWENGVDINTWLPYIDELHPTFYFGDKEVLSEKMEQYKELISNLHTFGSTKIIPALRVISPQVNKPEELVDQVQLLRGFSDGFSFYNYGFMPLQSIKVIPTAIHQAE